MIQLETETVNDEHAIRHQIAQQAEKRQVIGFVVKGADGGDSASDHVTDLASKLDSQGP